MFDWLVNGLKSFGTGIKDNRDLFAQYLAAAGADISDAGRLGKSFNAVTQQHIQNKNFRDMFSEIMKQGGTIKMDPKSGMTFNLPSIPGANPAGNPTQGPVNPQSGAAPVQMDTIPTLPSQPDMSNPVGVMSQFLLGGGLPSNSPFSVDLSNISNNGLAGLTPELMMAAVNSKFTQAGLQERSLADLQDMMYKNRMANVYERNSLSEAANSETARLNAYRQLADELRVAPIEVPGIGQIDLKSFNGLPDKVKAYSYYVFDQKMGGKEVLTYNDWERQVDDPTMILYYNMSKKDPKFKSFLMEYQKAGSTTVNLGPEAKANLQGKLYFKDPKFQEDRNKYLSSSIALDAIDSNARALMAANPNMKRDTAESQAAETEKYNWTKSMLTSGDSGGTIIKEYEKNGRWIFVVKWRDGDTTEVAL